MNIQSIISLFLISYLSCLFIEYPIIWYLFKNILFIISFIDHILNINLHHLDILTINRPFFLNSIYFSKIFLYYIYPLPLLLSNLYPFIFIPFTLFVQCSFLVLWELVLNYTKYVSFLLYLLYIYNFNFYYLWLNDWLTFISMCI